MKRLLTIVSMLAAVSAANSSCWAQVKFDGGPTGLGNAFLDAANWNPDGVPNDPNPLASGDPRFVINDGFTSNYATSATTTVEGLVVGGDAPQMGGDFGTPGTLNISAGKLIVSGGGDSFEIGRACCNDLAGDESTVTLSGDAVLEIQGSDPQLGDRDRGVLNIRDTASVISTRVGGGYWRVGNNGPSIDVGAQFPNGLAGEGLLNVEDSGSFRAHVIFLGANDGDGVVRVSDSGSVVLTDNLVMGSNPDGPNRSALVHMVGSSATLRAVNLESANGLSQVHNQFLFDAEPVGGVSPIELSNAVNITNNDLVVNLNGFVLPNGGTMLLFDAAPGQIYGTFASTTVNGSIIPHVMIYDNLTGDISVKRVPEPATLSLVGLGIVISVMTRKRTSRERD